MSAPVWFGSSRSPGYGVEVAQIADGAYALRNPRTGKVMVLEADQMTDFAVRLRIGEDMPPIGTPRPSGFDADAALAAMAVMDPKPERDGG